MYNNKILKGFDSESKDNFYYFLKRFLPTAYRYFLAFFRGRTLEVCRKLQNLFSLGDLHTSQYSFKSVCSATRRLKSDTPKAMFKKIMS